jgi:para-aminobenzoate synthetase component 1
MKTDFATLQTLMNSHGRRREPFVFVVDYAMEHCLFLPRPLEETGVWWATEHASNARPEADSGGAVAALRVISAPMPEEYERAFQTIVRGLRHGDSFLANLTGRAAVECNLTFEEVFARARAKYKLLLPDEFVCFSPESFVKISDGRIYAYPMKGTIDATEQQARERLLQSPKERCEHNTIVDLLRNDLSRVATNVCVSRFRYVESLSTQRGPLLQTSSEIVGQLPADWPSRLGDILGQLLPAGSICGAPKQATLRLIDQAETAPRGWYTGVWGYFDGLRLDSAVMIRCLQRGADGRVYFHSGGGITVNSLLRDEYAELLQKIYLPIP